MTILTIRIVILFFFILSTHSLSSQSYLNFDNQEKKYLECFIHTFFLEDAFSYTLFGEKPMSFSGIYRNNLNELSETRSLLKSANKLPLCKAVKIFSKNRKIINNRYVIVFNEYKNGTFIYFINRQSFAKTVVDNIDIFLQELGENFSVDAFLEEITGERRHFLDIIHHHEGILGILLGYGRHNSMLFQRKADILGRCWAYEDDIQLQSIKQKKINDVAVAEEELRYLNEQLGSFSEASEYNPLFPVAPLGFAADLDHPETKKLKKNITL